MFANTFKNRSHFYKIYVQVNLVAYTLLLLALALGSQAGGSDAGLAYIPLLIPAFILIPVNLCLVPVFLYRRMRSHDSSDRLVQVLALLLWLILIAWIAISFVVRYEANHRKQGVAGAKTYDQHALMTIGSSGGMCADGPCQSRFYNLYDNGKFEDHKKLTSAEVSKLRDVINATDFTKYGSNPHPDCLSFVDGTDLVLLFPQKYGGKMFTPCMLEVPRDDTAFSYIESVIQSH